MPQVQRGWQDWLVTAFGQDNEIGGTGNDAVLLRTGGVVATADPTYADGDNAFLRFTSAGALVVDVIGTEPIELTAGTITEVSNIAAGTITRVEGGSIDVTSITGDLAGGTIDLVTRVGNIGTLELGSVTFSGTQTTQMVNGTLNVGTVAINSITADLPGGTIDSGTVVGNVADAALATGNPIRVGGTDSGGTVYSLKVDTSGDVQADILTLPDLPGGTVDLVTTVTTVSNLTNGTVNVNTGTINVGTTAINAITADLPGGTVDLVTRTGNLGTLESGTIATLPDLPGGTIDSITNLAGGTVVTDNIQFRHADEFATVVSSGTSVMGTIKAAISGSAIYITDLIVSAASATDVEIGDGGTANPIVGTLHFGADGGMVAPNFKVYPRTSAGSALVYKQSADTPLTITCNGYVD